MILIGCCNKNSGLYICEDDLTNLKKIHNFECRGIAIDDEGNYYICSHDISGVYKLNKNFEIISKSQIIHHDVHGSFFYKDKLYVLVSFTDTIYVLNPNNLNIIDTYKFKEDPDPNMDYFDENGNKLSSLDDDKIRKWFYNKNGEFQVKDSWYTMNDLYIDNDMMYISMFRDHYKHADKVGKLSGNGFVKVRSLHDKSYFLGNNILNNLAQPHSPILYKNNIYCCNSINFTITSNYKKDFIQVDGFSRGLKINSNGIYVGISKSAQRPSAPGFNPKVECKIELFNKQTYEKINSLILPSDEIYCIKTINS